MSRADPADPFPLQVPSLARILGVFALLVAEGAVVYSVILYAIAGGVALPFVALGAAGLTIVLVRSTLFASSRTHARFEAGPVD